MTDILNQIHNLHILYPDYDARREEFILLKKDNHTNSTLIEECLKMYDTIV